MKNPSPHVKIGFIGKGSNDFRPSMNLAVEEDVDVSLKEYVKAVKELQLADPRVKWRDLGPLSMQTGKGHLIEMTNPSPHGELKILQAFFIEGGVAYILTAAILKEDFPKSQAELLKSMQSLRLVDDLWVGLSPPVPAEKPDEQWEKLQSRVKELSQMGPYWQFLALQEGHQKIYNGESL